MICAEKIHVARRNMLTKILISSKYKSLLNSDIWGNDVLPELNISSQIVDNNIREIDYLDMKNENILEHSYFMKKCLLQGRIC